TTISPRNTRPTPVYPSNSGSSGGTTIIVVPNNSSSSDREYIAPETNSDYTTPETNSDYTTPNTNSDYTTPNTNSDYTTPNTNSDYTTPDTNSDYTTPNTNSDYTTPNTNSDSQNSNWVANLLVFGLFLILGLITFSVFFFILKSLMSSNSNNNTVANAVANERDNDIVTISKLQVALLATATGVQTELSQLSLNVDTETEAGLMELLQESALILLRKSDHWSHVSSSSESINIENAETAFNRISLSERSKFSHESLVNVSGRISTRTINSSSANLGSYLVVTLLAGTADDQPLFGEIRTVNELKAALEKLAAMRSDYLMKFELLWTPQTEGESLSSDEMLSEYAAMYQLV
ncbi:MAG: DUF1517 domain-containing protein, partial [Oscillatoria sp. PMC 1076.18]|nr:DUF1517 domain-containing protein [Oscillatoria sp. PMC 1076.18]